MVSKILGLTLLAALASQANAYFYYAEIEYFGTSPTTIHYKIHPIDWFRPGNEIFIKENDAAFPGPAIIDMTQYSYQKLKLEPNAQLELTELVLIPSGSRDVGDAPCTRFDKNQAGIDPATATITKMYICGGPEYYGRNGETVPKPTPTPCPVVPTTTCPVVPTTTCPAVTVTVPVTVPVTPTTTNPPPTTTSPQKPSPTCLAGYKGKGNGKGPDGACCSLSDDCKDTCVKGICRDRCLTGYKGKKNGKGPNGACCSHSDDCKDTCVKGICGVHP